MNSLQKSVISTIAYYDVMDYPMTAFEIWKYLISDQETMNSDQEKKNSLLEIIKILESEEMKKSTQEFRGFFFLKGRKNLVEERIKKNKLSASKYKKIEKTARWLRFVPFVRMIAVTGTVAMKNTEKESDLDLLVALKHGHIFTGRALFTLMVHLLGKRRHGKKIRDRICLNYFITTRSLKIAFPDLFSSSEYMFIRPVFGFRVFRKFQEQNGWMKKIRGNFLSDSARPIGMVQDTFFSKLTRKIGEKIFGFGFLEQWMKNWQIKRIERNPKSKLKDNLIIANDEMLVFLPEPQGPKVFEKFQENLDKLGNLC